MSREIKFRAWDKNGQAWVYLTLPKHSLDISLDLGRATKAEGNADVQDWLQFTGLFDKHGVEIYEGDVVEYMSLGEEEVTRGQVAYRKSYFTVTNPNLDYPNDYHGWDGLDLEVIGNIYENGDLQRGTVMLYRELPLPKARVGDVILGDLHPSSKGYVMFRVGRVYRNEQFNWIYTSEDGKDECNEIWLTKVYKQRNLK